MTGRERLLCVLSREIPDRVPVSLFVQEEYLSWFYPKREKVTRLTDAVDCARYYGFDITTREAQFIKPFWLRKSYPNWEVNEKTWVDNEVYYRQSTITTPKGLLNQVEVAPYNPRTLAGIHFHTRDFFIRSSDDFEIFREYFPDEDSSYLEERREAARFALKIIGDTGIGCPWGTGGVYNRMAECRDMQELMMDPLINPDFYKEMAEFFSAWLVSDTEKMCDNDYDAVGIQGNIANGGLIGEAFFSEHIQPYEQQIIDVIRSCGKYSVYHNCGYARNLYPCYRAMKMDVWETLSAPPQGDNDLAEAKDYFGDSLILSGNLDQVIFLKNATVNDVRETVSGIVETGKSGGNFIFAASDFLEKDTPEENIRAAVETAIDVGRYA